MIPLFYLDECLSTNDEVLLFLKPHQETPIAIYTFRQTKGRGQYGNTWETSQNKNLAITFAFKKSDFVLSDCLFNYCTAMVLRNFLAILTKEKIEIKWPNDIIINEKKIAGILIEKKKVNKTKFYIVGIGINILQQNFRQMNTAGSLLTQTKQSFELHSFTEKLRTYFQQNFISYSQKENLLEEFNFHLFRKNKISVFEIGDVRQNGIILNADKNGQLRIDLENDGTQSFSYKEIKLLY